MHTIAKLNCKLLIFLLAAIIWYWKLNHDTNYERTKKMLINIVFAVRCTIIQQYSSAVCTLRAMISANAAHKVRYMLVLHKLYGVQCNTMIRKRISTTTIDIKTMNRTAKRNENYLRCALHFASLIYPLVTMHPIFKCFSFKRARAISFAYWCLSPSFMDKFGNTYIWCARARNKWNRYRIFAFNCSFD